MTEPVIGGLACIVGIAVYVAAAFPPAGPKSLWRWIRYGE